MTPPRASHWSSYCMRHLVDVQSGSVYAERLSREEPCCMRAWTGRLATDIRTLAYFRLDKGLQPNGNPDPPDID